MNRAFNRKSQKFVTHITNVFPLVLVLFSLAFVQALPILGDAVSKNIGIEICSSLGAKYVYSVDDLAEQDKERNYCAFCSVQHTAFILAPDTSYKTNVFTNDVLYTINTDYIYTFPSAYRSHNTPRAPPIYS